MIKRIPIIGTVFTLPRSAVNEALIDMGLTILFSTLPIWMGILLSLSNAAWADGAQMTGSVWHQSIYGQLDRGEMLMYVAALMGPTFYLALKHLRRPIPPTPWTGTQVILCVVLNLIATALFVHGRINNYVDEPSFINVSIVFYLAALVLLFPAKAHENARGPDLETSQHKSERLFHEDYLRHRRGGKH